MQWSLIVGRHAIAEIAPIRQSDSTIIFIFGRNGIMKTRFSMERIIIQVKDKRKARALLDFLASLDFIEAVSTTDLPTIENDDQAHDDDFFALAGLWAKRNVTSGKIRQKAWPKRL
jgi:hypothetical protein